MDNHSLLAVSPIDGRYSRQTEPLREYFSEYALIKYRVRVEIEYFIALCQIPLPQLADFDSSKFEALRDIYRNMTPEDAAKVKEIEKVTNHDVKAVEYFIKDRFKEMDILKWGEFVHFGLTSQDINNTSVPLSLKEALEEYDDDKRGKGECQQIKSQNKQELLSGGKCPLVCEKYHYKQNRQNCQ